MEMRHLLVIALLVVEGVVCYKSPTYVTTEKLVLKLDDNIDTADDLLKDDLSIFTKGPSPSSFPATSSSSPSITSDYTQTNPSESASTTLQNVGDLSSVQSTLKPIAALPNKIDDLESDPNLETSDLPSYLPEDETNRRRVITYDQRQEGQYNIRADLENFMIVLIPSGAQEGLNLIDLLTKSSSFKRNPLSQSNKRNRYSSSALQSGTSKYQQAIKLKQNLSNLNYLVKNSPFDAFQRNNYHSEKSDGSLPSYRQNLGTAHIPDFIEGRTPYHVDISASDDEQTRLHPDRPVDVIPPPYPLAFQQLIKPYHLEAEPTIIQALPPPEIRPAAGNFLETLLGSGNFRSSRAISTEKSYIDNNNLNSFSYRPAESDSLPLYRADLSYGANKQYPPLDVPHYKDFVSLTSSNNIRRRNSLHDPKQELEDYLSNDFFVPPVLLGRDSTDFDLILGSGGYIDPISKALLSDGIARCGLGRRRDSYGVCREIEGY